ncbi:hypothetical protein LZ554_009371 [Drepanopeziza brunnea f. sp. 'monogermtubi']|nr:hypothetical protein LZ554_009371 [Drepanopeziza brunnea f. sp. 'monogermtubi']
MHSLLAAVDDDTANHLKTHLAPDLRRVFKHPAGLRTARFIVTSYLRASQNHDRDIANSPFSPVSPPTFDSSPEVASLLDEILAFSEAENMALGLEDGNGSGNRDRDLTAEEAAACTLSLLRAQQPRPQNSFTASPFASTNAPNDFYAANPTQPFLEKGLMQRIQHYQDHRLPTIYDLARMELTYRSSSGSSVHGTASPYNVESPSGRSIAPSMSRQSSSTLVNGSSLPHQESEPLQLDRSSPHGSKSASGQAPAYIQPKLSNGGGLSTQTNSHPSSYQEIQPRNSSTGLQGHTVSNQLSKMEKFLPINKAPNNVMTAKKDPLQLQGNRPANNKVVSGFSPQCVAITSDSRDRLISPRPSTTDHPLFIDQTGTTVMQVSNAKKRKPTTIGVPREKRQKTDKAAGRFKRVTKGKEEKKIPAAHRLCPDLWLRIIEFSPPSFLKKVRLLNKTFKDMVDGYDSVYVNQRMENFGADFPIAQAMGLTERQYTNLLGGKGCLDCDDKKASRTHWSWAKRWCTDCWRVKIEREDRLLKSRLNELPQRQTLVKLLECIPAGMHDSFMKAHDYIEDLESRPSTAPKIYKYYLKAEVDKIIEEYQSFKIEPFKDDPTKSAAENATARTAHQQAEAEAVAKQTAFLDERKEQNDQHMQRVLKIEGAIRLKRQGDAQPYNENRSARRALFIRRAKEDIPDIPTSFVVGAKAFKAATRIFRDPGTERGWRTLKPKIQQEWDDGAEKRRQAEEDARIQEARNQEARMLEARLLEARMQEARIQKARIQDAENDDSSRIDQPQGGTSRMSCMQQTDRQPDRQPPNIQQHHLGALAQSRPSQFFSQQQQQRMEVNMRARLQDHIHAVNYGTFDNPYGGNSDGFPGMNNGGSGSGLQSDYNNTMFYTTPSHYQTQYQLPDPYNYLNSGIPQMSSGFGHSFQGPFVQHQQIPNICNFNYAGPSSRQHSQDGKIPIGSLLSNPAPNASHHFGGFQ